MSTRGILIKRPKSENAVHGPSMFTVVNKAGLTYFVHLADEWMIRDAMRF